LLTIAAMVAGCSGGSDANAQKQEGKEEVEKAAEAPQGGIAVPTDVPEYTLRKDETTANPALGLRMRGVSASTKTTSDEDMETIMRELWSETNDADALVAAFYPDKPMAELSGSGYAFRNREATCAVLSSQYTDPSEANIDEQVEEAMANDGISVLVIQDEVDAATDEMCAEWEVTTTLGTPPPEWDCPGY
jgi:hypothetical protein